MTATRPNLRTRDELIAYARSNVLTRDELVAYGRALEALADSLHAHLNATRQYAATNNLAFCTVSCPEMLEFVKTIEAALVINAREVRHYDAMKHLTGVHDRIAYLAARVAPHDASV